MADDGGSVSRRGLLGLGLHRLTPAYLDRLGGDEARPRSASPPASSSDDWAGVDARPLARAVEPALAALADVCAPAAGAAALAVAAADGDLAIALARRGAEVTACDASDSLRERGGARTAAAGAAIEWHLAPVTRLPFGAESFDSVAAGFAAAGTGRAGDVARELFRVVRPGGVVAVVAWSAAGLMGEVLDALHRSGVHGPDAPRPTAWGRYETVYREFMSHTDDFGAADRELVIDHAPAALWALLAGSYAPLAGWIRRADPDRVEALRREVEMIARLYDAQRREGTGLPAAYVVNYGRKPG